MKTALKIMATALLSTIITCFFGCKKNNGDNGVVVIVNTHLPQEITATTAVCSGDVAITQGFFVDKTGVCWNKDGNPTVNDEFVSVPIVNDTMVCTLVRLDPNTEYHVRAYALYDSQYFYGEDVSFHTLVAGEESQNLPIVLTMEPNSISSEQVAICGNVLSEGDSPVNKRGICFGLYPGQTIDSIHTIDSCGPGVFQTVLEGLIPNTMYYYCAYASNDFGTSYGEELSFITMDGLPVVKTIEVLEIGSRNAVVKGYVEDEGVGSVTEKGICWSILENPTIVGNHIVCGEGFGEFDGLINLNPQTTYFTCAYAINSCGISYGKVLGFTSLEAPPPISVVTIEISSINVQSALIIGEVVSDGGLVIRERGFCLGENIHPTIEDNYLSCGNGLGIFEGEIGCLENSKQYYVRAYASNGIESVYGNELCFSTKEPILPEGAVNGLFSVDECTKVFFSQGNLQYQASTNTWRFAENQWDFVGSQGPSLPGYGHYPCYQGNVNGSSNHLIAPDYSGWIDLFGWGTSGWDCGNIYYQPYDIEYNGSATGSMYGPPGGYDLTQQYKNSDWGVYNAISNGGNRPGMWRTLTQQEWVYLFHTRNTNSGIRFVGAEVNDTKGIILLPDSWDINTYPLNMEGNNVISVSLWIDVFENNGAVFLPAGGSRIGTYGSEIGCAGRYWSSSCWDEWSAQVIYGSLVGMGFHCSRVNGNSVRLVCPVENSFQR